MSYHFTSLLHICTFSILFFALLPAGFFRFPWFILHRTRKRPLMPFLLISLLPCRCQTSRSCLQLFLNASASIWIHAKDRVSVFPDLVSCYWFARAYCDFKLGQVPRYAKDLMGPLKSEIRSRPSGGTSLTDPESRLNTKGPEALLQAHACRTKICKVLLWCSLFLNPDDFSSLCCFSSVKKCYCNSEIYSFFW